MKTVPHLLALGLAITLATGCAKSQTAPTPVPGSSGLVLTLQRDTGSPVGQAVAVTYGSRQRSPGKITVAVSGFNLQNILPGTAANGVQSIEGRLKYDDAVLELERTAETLEAGDFMQQGAPSSVICCKQPNTVAQPGLYPFYVWRNGVTVQGSGELFLATFKPRPGVTSTTTRIDLVPFNASEADPRLSFMTPLLIFPYLQSRGNVIDNAYGGTITIRPGS